MTGARARSKLARVLPILRREYGDRSWQRWGSGVKVLVGTILSQNTSGQNSTAGFRQLWRRFRSFSAIADAPVDEIEKCIRVSGLSRIKAPRIRKILRRVRGMTPGKRVSLQFIERMPEDEAYRLLLSFDGVGPKTAACVLLFAFGKTLFPVDTHIVRIAIRLGILPPGAGAERAQELMTPWIPPADRYAMHILLIAHGRQTCRAQGPRCDFCPLLPMCPHGRERMKEVRPRRGQGR